MTPTSLEPLRNGATFHGRYEIVRVIKSGGMGTVYEVLDQVTRRPRALKTMLPNLVGDSDLLSRFRLEATVAAEVDSSHIVEVFDAGIDDTTTMPYLVMELLRGKDLGSLLESHGRLNAADVLVYLRQAALALDQTHANGIVHRDLKPENLFLTTLDDGSPHIKVLDFGIAKVISQSGTFKTTRNIGTPLYMSPEQIRGDGTIGTASDRYACGHIAFTLLVGHSYWTPEATALSAAAPLLVRVLQGKPEPATQTSQDEAAGGVAGSQNGGTAGARMSAGGDRAGGGAANTLPLSSAGSAISTAGGSDALVGGGTAIGGTSGVAASAGKSSVGQGGTQLATVGGGASFAGSTQAGGLSSTLGGASASSGGMGTGGNFCTGILAFPTNTAATDGTDDTRISLRWTPAPCAESYEIYRATAPDGTYEFLGSTGLGVFDDTNNQDTIPYYYKLRSHSVSQGYSDYTAPFKGSRKQGYLLDASWGSSGSGDGQFSSAYGIATDSSNNVYVLDTYNHRVQKFDSTGTLMTKWGGLTLSGEPGKFYYPKAISIANDTVYVGDDGGSVQKFSATGTYIDSFDIGTATSLSDVDLDTSGNLFVAYNAWASSTQSLLIGKYNAAFALQTTFGGSGEAEGQFSREIQIAVDPARALAYASDTGHSKVHLFTLSGTYVNAWGTTGSSALQFDGPAGIAVDPNGDVYVADEGNDRISKFSVSNGTAALVATWSSPRCRAISIDSNGRVVVMATDNAKVLIYRRR